MVSYRDTIMATSGLVAYWRFGEPAGSVAAEERGAHPGSYVNTPTLGVPGALTDGNTAASFAWAQAEYVTVPHHAALNLGDVFTFSAWVRLRRLGGFPRYLVSKNPGAYGVRVESDDRLSLVAVNRAIIASSTVPLDTGWHHVAVTKNGATVGIYIDGVARTGTVTNTALVNTALPLRLAADDHGGESGIGVTDYHDGVLDEVALFGRALSASEVAAQFAAAEGPLPTTPGLAVQFREPPAGPWRSIECRVFGAGWTRGSSEYRGVLGLPDAGQASVLLFDPTRALDPANPAGPYPGEIDIGVELRLVNHGVLVFGGRVTELDHRLEPAPRPGGPGVPVVRMAAVDAQARMSATPGAVGTVAGETMAARIGRFLDAAKVAMRPGERDLEPGGEPLQAVVYQGDFWNGVVETVTAELGSIEFDGYVVRSRIRGTVWGAAPAPTLQLGCHAGAIPVADATFRLQRDTIRNTVFAKRISGAYFGYTQAASENAYGYRAMFREGLWLNTDPQADTWTSFTLAHFVRPLTTWRVTVRARSAADIAAIEAPPLYTGWARLTIDDQGPPIDVTLRLVGVEWSVDDTGQQVAVLTLGADPPPPAVAELRAADVSELEAVA